MNQDKYEKFMGLMNAIDEDFLLEAMEEPVERVSVNVNPAEVRRMAEQEAKQGKRSGLRSSSFRRWALRGGLVACCVLMVLATGKYINPAEEVAQAATLEEIEAAGYDMSLPEGAEDVSYYWLDRDTAVEADADNVDMAQATFTIDGTEYTYRVLLGTEQADLFVVLNEDSDETKWSANDISIYVEDSGETSYVGWYDASAQTQWCLASDSEKDEALDAAYSILAAIGFDIGTAPEDAKNVSYDIFPIKALASAKEPEAVDGITVTDLTYELDGNSYAYRIGIPIGVPDEVPDISETNGNYEITVDTSDESTWVGWCQTAIYYTPGGAGKIVWYDVVPGICYSLTVDNGASEDSLRDMAEHLYTPMQGDS